MEETEKKIRKPRKDKGIPRGKKIVVQHPAPIDVRIRLKGCEEYVEFGCAIHAVEGQFHVFVYPSEKDRYRQTRREFAITEIVELEITEAARTYETRPQSFPFGTGINIPAMMPNLTVTSQADPEPTGPKIHSVRKNLEQRRGGRSLIERLEQSNGPIRMTAEDLTGALNPGGGAQSAGVGDSTT